MIWPSNFLRANNHVSRKKFANSTADSKSWVGSRGTPSGVPTQEWARGLVKVTPRNECVGLPQQQPAAKHPTRPIAWPSASPGAKASQVARAGIRLLRIYQIAAAKAASKPPEKTPPACKVPTLKISPGWLV